MSDDVAAGRLERCCAGEAGEVVPTREPADVADLAEDDSGQHRTDADDAGEVGAGRFHRRADLFGDRLDLAVETYHVLDQVFALVADSFFGAPEGISSLSSRWIRFSV